MEKAKMRAVSSQISDYWSCRAFYQRHKHRLTKIDLLFLKTQISSVSYRHPHQKDQFEDLILDIENDIDLYDMKEKIKNPTPLQLRGDEIITGHPDIHISIAGYKGENLLQDAIRTLYSVALEKMGQNRNQTSKLLGCSIRGLRDKINGWIIDGFSEKLN